MAWPMCKTEWEILDELDRGVMKWGAAVAAVWKNLHAHGYVGQNFGDITDAGRAASAQHKEG